MSNLKPATKYADQAKLIAQKGIIVNSNSVCMDFFSHVNYYRFSGYFLPFIDKKTEICTVPVSFEQLRDIYSFDTELRCLLSTTIETIEIYIRTQLAYYSGHKYGPDGYTDACNFNKYHDHIEFNKRINGCISDNRNTLVVKHHMNKYGGRFPIWVIIEFFSLGMTSFFFSDMKNADKACIAQSTYGVNYQVLSSWLRCLTDLRNKCAHYSRLYYWSFPAIPKMPKGVRFTPDSKLFSQIYMLKLMYPIPSEWNKAFLGPLKKIFKKYSDSICREHIGFPYRWKSMLTI